MELGLRIDVDTRVGLREGVPRLLELFQRYSIKASFFVTFGPDRSGRAIARIWQPGFLLKMWRTKALRLYGLRTLLSGTLLPSVPIGEGSPELLNAIKAEGHEVGIHGYDHVYWQDRVETMEVSEVEAELGRARKAYERVLGSFPLSSAAPGWRCTSDSLWVQERLGLLYASDVRGSSPFLPVHENRSFNTLQLPTTLPTLDELLGRGLRINDCLFSSLKDGLNVHTIHAEVEGRPHLSLFEEFLRGVLERGIKVVRLCDLARMTLNRLKSIPRAAIGRQEIPGRSGWVACQIAFDR